MDFRISRHRAAVLTNKDKVRIGEQPIEDMEHFAHDRDEGDQFGFNCPRSLSKCQLSLHFRYAFYPLYFGRNSFSLHMNWLHQVLFGWLLLC
jgi:hypothetical protein